jgi:predicted nucleotidyltransferase
MEQRLTRAALLLEAVEGLLAAVLFGSAARGTPTPWSDVDIGLLGVGALPRATLDALEGDLTPLLGRPVDLVDLRRAPLPLRGRVARDARLLLLRDRQAWLDFVTASTVDWLDFKPLHERAVRVAVARLAGSGGGHGAARP